MWYALGQNTPHIPHQTRLFNQKRNCAMQSIEQKTNDTPPKYAKRVYGWAEPEVDFLDRVNQAHLQIHESEMPA